MSVRLISNLNVMTLTFNDLPILATVDNPYLLLNRAMLVDLIKVRDIAIDGDMNTLANYLNHYDQVLPDWKEKILNTNINRLTTLELLTGGAIKGINVRTVAEQITIPNNTNEVKCLIVCLLLLPKITEPKIPRPFADYTSPVKYQSIYQAITSANAGTDARYDSQVVKAGFLFTENNLTELMDINSVISTTNRYRDVNIRAFNGMTAKEIALYLTEISIYPLNIDPIYYLLLRIIAIPSMLQATLIVLGIPRDTVLFINKEQLIFIISRGYLPSLNIENHRTRYNSLTSLSDDVKRLLYQLYQVENESNPLVVVASHTPNPMEEIIIKFGTIPTIDLAQSIGMIIPPNVDPNSYFQDNVIQYQYILTRDPTSTPSLTLNDFNKDILKYYTDNEIFNILNVYVPYYSRSDIYDLLINLKTEPNFFVPLKRNCLNPSTLVNVENTNDPNVFIIAYGTLTDYNCFDIDDLLGSFVIEGQGFYFKNVLRPKLVYKTSQIEQLLSLLYRYPQGNERLIQRINEGLIAVRELSNYDRKLVSQLKQFDLSDRDSLRRFLRESFNTGMYMRRWLGPGNSYPLTKVQTNIDVDPFANVTVSLNSMKDIYKLMSPTMKQFTYNLHIIEYLQGIPEHIPFYLPNGDQTNLFGLYFDFVYRGEECIRVASTKFIGTGYHYLTILFNETISNFNLSQLALIS